MARIRALLARFLPQGAILLSILTFAAYAAGLLRDRLFARTYGAGMELDAYNAAFVLPELALDVLVAAGLTAPFVPVFSTLRREDPDAAPRFAQTVLTLAVLVMGVTSLGLLLVAPATVELIAPGFDPAGRELYLELFRLMLLTPILFAASIALGEVLVAERRFLFYALAPRSCTTSASPGGRSSSTTRWASVPQRSAPWPGRRSTWGSGWPGSCARRSRCDRAWTCACRRCTSSCG